MKSHGNKKRIDMNAKISIAPIMYNVSDEDFLQFYKAIAKQASVSDVHIGEVVCVKRAKKQSVYEDAIKYLEDAEKRVFISTPALIMDKRDEDYLENLIDTARFPLEINDMTAFCLAKDNKPFSVGPFVNIYNEQSAKYFADKNPIKISLPVETDENQIKHISNFVKTPLEVTNYGRLPLALSARCYLAKHYEKNKLNCGFVCQNHPNGLEIKTIDGKDILNVSGTMTMSSKVYKEKFDKAVLSNTDVSFIRANLVNIYDINEFFAL
jgi:collagenase-like PrtC family protease